MSAALQVLLLTAVYALALGSLEPLDLAAGALLSAGCVFALRHLHATEPSPAPSLPLRVLRFPVLAAAVLRDLLAGTWQVALAVTGVRAPDAAGIVAVPLDGRTPTGVAVSALAVTLSPGELFVDVDWEAEEMLVHVLDASDPEAVRRRHRRFYERYQRTVFP